MRIVDEMTPPEIALALGVPVGTVKSRVHNALRALRQDPRLATPDTWRHGRGEAPPAPGQLPERQSPRPAE